jgi:hypothetical protein
LLFLLAGSINLLALLVALQSLLLALCLLDRVAPDVWPGRRHRRVRVAIHVGIALGLFTQRALPDGFFARWPLAARALLLLARELALLALLLARLAQQPLRALLR